LLIWLQTSAFGKVNALLRKQGRAGQSGLSMSKLTGLERPAAFQMLYSESLELLNLAVDSFTNAQTTRQTGRTLIWGFTQVTCRGGGGATPQH
jgi:hypothetical protein